MANDKIKLKIKKPSLPKLTQLTCNSRYEIEITTQQKKAKQIKNSRFNKLMLNDENKNKNKFFLKGFKKKTNLN
jgi:hypothetical protein